MVSLEPTSVTMAKFISMFYYLRKYYTYDIMLPIAYVFSLLQVIISEEKNRINQGGGREIKTYDKNLIKWQ